MLILVLTAGILIDALISIGKDASLVLSLLSFQRKLAVKEALASSELPRGFNPLVVHDSPINPVAELFSVCCSTLGIA